MCEKDREINDKVDRLCEEVKLYKNTVEYCAFVLGFINYILQIPMVIGALFGMNLLGIPFSTHPNGFWIITFWCVILVIIELVIVVLAIKVISKYLKWGKHDK